MASAIVDAIKQQHQRFKSNGGLMLTGGGGAAAAGGGPKAFREVDIATVTILFPLPAEDPLIHQRKAAELARALGNDQGELLSNVKTFCYDRLKRSKQGCEIVGKTRPELGLHALVKFNTVKKSSTILVCVCACVRAHEQPPLVHLNQPTNQPTNKPTNQPQQVLGDELGQGVICLPDPGNKIIGMEVDIKLSVGGTLRGKMRAQVAVEQIDFTSALLSGEESRSAGGADGAGVGPTAQIVGGGGGTDIV